MATLKSVSRSKRSESLRGSFMVDTVRGVIRIRKWPRKRGTPKSALQRWWIDWFKQANYLAKYVDGETAARAIEITAGSGMYPRDVILSAMRGRLYSWYDQTGKVWHSMAGIQDVSDSLDFLGQAAGDILVRAADRWRPPAAPTAGQVLTARALPLAPHWQTPALAGWYSGGALVYRSTNQVIATGAWRTLSWDQEDYDSDSIHDPAVNPTRLNVPAGWTGVILSVSAGISANAVGERALGIIKNGAALRGCPWGHNSSPGTFNGWLQAHSTYLPVVGGTDYFEAQLYQDSGGNLNALAGTQLWFSMLRAS